MGRGRNRLDGVAPGADGRSDAGGCVEAVGPGAGYWLGNSWREGAEDRADGTWFIGTKVDEDHVWNDVKEGKVKGYSIEGFFNEVGVAMSGVKNHEAELVLELDQLLAGLGK